MPRTVGFYRPYHTQHALHGNISLPNIPSDLSLLAFGIPPAREAESVGGMSEVPKGQELARLVRHFILAGVTSSVSDACCLASRQQQK